MIQLLQTGIDPLFWAWVQFCLYFALFALVAIPAIIIAWAIWEFWITPPESREIRAAKRQHRSLNFLAGDDGFFDLEKTDRTGPEGVIQTKAKGKKPKSHWTGFLSRYQPLNGQVEVEGDADADLTRRTADFISGLTTKRMFLRGAKVPINFGYKGKSILTSLLSLIGLDIVEMLATYKDKPKEALEKVLAACQGKFNVDVLVLKSLFDSSWNESQINAQEEDMFRAGYAEAKRKSGDRMPLLWLIAVIGLVLGIGVILVVLFYFMSH